MDKRLENLHRALHPRAIAVVGARKVDDYAWLRNMRTFAGPVYSVNIDENEIPGIEALGIPNYKRLTDIPGPVDFVAVWASLCRQSGALEINSLEEMVDTIKALQHLKPSGGQRLALVALTGGPSVVSTDAFAKQGLEIPALSELREQYGKPLLAVVGSSPFEKDEVDFRRELLEIGIPAFYNFERAACAYRQVSTYHRLHPISDSTHR